MKPYDHGKIEAKWQKYWESKKLFHAKEGGKKFYPLIEFPFPSGDGLHVGHIRSNTAMDILARKRRLEGYNVLYPIGWDAFGLPTENYAIKTGKQPALVTKQNSDTFRKQLKALGFSFDWSREINTSDPAYYKWTQWIFLQLLKQGLAYKKKMFINWCPKDLIGLANEEVIDGKCERCGTAVEKKEKEQWMLAITKYAERLDKDLDDTDFLEKIKIQQRNWIGKSEGAEIDFELVLKENKPRFVLLHGFEGSAKTNFFPWLKKALEDKGYEVDCPELPNSNNPNEAEQVEHVLKTCTLDDKTVIVGHSLGAVVAQKVLMKLNKPISGLVIVASATDKDFPGAKARKYWNGFSWNLDYEKIKKNITAGIAILSDLQEPQRMPYLKFLSEKLGAFLIETKAVDEHFYGDQEPAILKCITPSVPVFTTRPDTIFGVTYMVLSPEHPWVAELLPRLKNKTEVEKYIAGLKGKTEIERTSADKEKTGVELKGLNAINPATGKEIPVWIADYVLADYGTGAVMAVPAHDERDAAFANKYKLPVTQVVEPVSTQVGDAAPKPGLEFIKREAVCCVVRNPKDDTYLCVSWKKAHMNGLVTGGIDEGENPIDAGLREVREETGYKNIKFVRDTGFKINTFFYHRMKNVNRHGHFQVIFYELENEERVPLDPEEEALHEIVWKKKHELKDFFSVFEGDCVVDLLNKPHYAYTGDGILANSGKFNGKKSEDIRKEITESVGGKWVTKFKLRDWIFSRQRYWGEPIPVVHCEKCGIVPLPEKDLPLKLPPVKNYKPTENGESPLAAISKWVNTKCPTCKGKARRETDTMPNWAGSSWYYLRYTDPKNKKAFADKKKLDYWTPVDWYNGGMEHTTLHLLYSRFWHKFLFDQGLVPTSEPYKKRTSHGLILAKDGEKMSKSKGNVVNPDPIVKTVGADALRLYEMFMGPFDQHIAWDENGIVGTRRFIEKVWKLREKVGEGKSEEVTIQKLIKKISDDIEAMKFNTAISAMMIAVNEMEKQTVVATRDYSILLQLLSPFAPHVAEELWASLGNKKSILLTAWPVFDPAKVMEMSVRVMIQVNGKVRGSFDAAIGTGDAELEKTARALPEIQKWIVGNEVKKIIIIKGKVVNFVL